VGGLISQHQRARFHALLSVALSEESAEVEEGDKAFMDILYLVDRLENLVASSRRMPLLNQVIVKEGDLLNIIDLMRTSIPDEVKQARRVLQEKDRVLAQAQAEAAAILAHAQEEAARMIQREGLLHTAEERSQEILRRANDQAQAMVQRAEDQTLQLQNEADAYAAETLRNLREHLMSIGTDIERTILSIERGLDSLEGQGDEQDPGAETIIQQPKPPPQQLTRRASLAADTMGGPSYPM